jgi:hypothetical protein
MIEEVVAMRDTNERPVCHRAEDLVTYLYGEAGEADTLDFHEHLKACDACRSEFRMFNQVHDSIVVWRNEVLGSSPNAAPIMVESAAGSREFSRSEQSLSALAAIREFFSVSPLWLRGATVLSALLLCVLAIIAISRLSTQPVQVAGANPELKYSEKDLNSAVQKGIDDKLAELNKQPAASPSGSEPVNQREEPRLESSAHRTQPRKTLPKGLTRQEREQLAADLRLLPGADEDEMSFDGSTDEPN